MPGIFLSENRHYYIPLFRLLQMRGTVMESCFPFAGADFFAPVVAKRRGDAILSENNALFDVIRRSG